MCRKRLKMEIKYTERRVFELNGVEHEDGDV